MKGGWLKIVGGVIHTTGSLLYSLFPLCLFPLNCFYTDRKTVINLLAFEVWPRWWRKHDYDANGSDGSHMKQINLIL